MISVENKKWLFHVFVINFFLLVPLEKSKKAQRIYTHVNGIKSNVLCKTKGQLLR